MLFEIAMIILVVYYFSKDPSHVKDWENYFIEQYEARDDRIVRLKFDSTNTALLIRLCKKKVKKKDMLSYPPCKEINFIAFKKHKHPPFRAEMIRCKKKFAIIDAPGHHCAYVLRKGKEKEYVTGTVFYISEKFCYHPPKDKYPNAEHKSRGFDVDQYLGQYQGREYRANWPNYDHYARYDHQPNYSFLRDQNNKSNYRQWTGDSYGKFYNNQLIPETKSIYYNPQQQLDEQYPSWAEKRNRELRYARRNPAHRYTDYSPHNEELELRGKMEPTHEINYSSPVHRPRYAEEHSHFDDGNLHYSTRHNQSLPMKNYHWAKSDEPDRNIGYIEKTFPRGDHLPITRLTYAGNSHMKNEPPLHHSSGNNQSLPYFQDKLPSYQYSNPYYQSNNVNYRPDEYGTMSPRHYQIPSYRNVYFDKPTWRPNLNNENPYLSTTLRNQSDKQDYLRYQTELYRKNAQEPTFQNEFQYSNNRNYRQSLYSKKEDYLASEQQPLNNNNDNYTFDKLHEDELLRKADSYKPREVNLESEIPEKTQPIHNAEDICDECSSEQSYSTNMYDEMESFSSCDECNSEQSCSTNMYDEIESLSSPTSSKKNPISNNKSSNKNKTLKSMKNNKMHNKQQLLLRNQGKQSEKYGRVKLQREYPIYGQEIHQESHSDEELQKLSYSGKIFKLEEESSSSSNELEELPSSYFVSNNRVQTVRRPAEYKSNKNLKKNLPEDDQLFENHKFNKTKQMRHSYLEELSLPTKPKKKYLPDKYQSLKNVNNLSISSTDEEIEPNSYRQQQRRYRKLYMRPSLPIETTNNPILFEKANLSQNVESNSNSDEEEKISTSSEDEPIFPTVSEDNDYSSTDEETKSPHQFPRSVHSLPQQTFGKRNQSEQKKNNYLDWVDETEQACSKQRSRQLNKKNQCSGRKLVSYDDEPEKENITMKYKLSKNNNKETTNIPDHRNSLKARDNNYNESLKRVKYPQTRNKIMKTKDISDSGIEEELQSSTADNASSFGENQDYEITSEYILTKNKEIDPIKSTSNINKEKINIQPSTPDNLSSPQSQHNDSRKMSEYFLTKTKNTEPKSQLDQNEEKDIQSSEPNHSSSPKNQKDYNTRITRSVYPLSGNIYQLDQSKKSEHTLLKTQDDLSSSEVQVDDTRNRRPGNVLIKNNKEMETRSQLNQNEEEKMQSNRSDNLSLSKSQDSGTIAGYSLNKDKEPEPKSRSDQNKEKNTQSSTSDDMSSPENQDNDIEITRSHKEIESNSQSDPDKEERVGISISKNQDGDMGKIKSSNLFTQNIKTETKSQSDPKKEKQIQSSTPANESSPESQDDDQKTIGSGYLLTKII